MEHLDDDKLQRYFDGELTDGEATAFIGLIVIVPVIGYAAWHGYLETIIADDFPRHEIGITATPREDNHAEAAAEESSITQ